MSSSASTPPPAMACSPLSRIARNRPPRQHGSTSSPPDLDDLSRRSLINVRVTRTPRPRRDAAGRRRDRSLRNGLRRLRPRPRPLLRHRAAGSRYGRRPPTSLASKNLDRTNRRCNSRRNRIKLQLCDFPFSLPLSPPPRCASPSRSRPEQPRPKQPNEQWVQLFNGKDLTGWGHVGNEKWTVEDGVIHGLRRHQRLRLPADTRSITRTSSSRCGFKCVGDGNSGVFFHTRFKPGTADVAKGCSSKSTHPRPPHRRHLRRRPPVDRLALSRKRIRPSPAATGTNTCSTSKATTTSPA